MATFQKFNQFAEDLCKGVHNLATGALVLALSAVAPVAANSILANLTQISYTNLSTRAVTTTSCVQTAGTAKLLLVDVVLTATGTVASFQYVSLYNDTPSSPADPLIGFYDYGSGLVLLNGETFTVDFDGSAGVLTVA